MAESNITFDGDRVKYRGKEFLFPNLEFRKILGEASNGIVLLAINVRLNRLEAVKLWKKKPGSDRSQAEISKLAQIEHPLFVRVYDFYYDQEVPICRMEYVDGMDGKKFLETHKKFYDRLRLWILYSDSLKILYKKKIFHGDPHLGNIFISEAGVEIANPYIPENLREQNKISTKLGDFGTSIFWNEKTIFIQREKKIIVEVFKKIFGNFFLNLVVINYKDEISFILYTLDCLAKLIMIYEDSKSIGPTYPVENLDDLELTANSLRAIMSVIKLSWLLSDNPVFQLVNVYDDMFKYPKLKRSDIFNGLGHSLSELESGYEYNSISRDDIIKMMETYKKKRISFLEKQSYTNVLSWVEDHYSKW